MVARSLWPTARMPRAAPPLCPSLTLPAFLECAANFRGVPFLPALTRAGEATKAVAIVLLVCVGGVWWGANRVKNHWA